MNTALSDRIMLLTQSRKRTPADEPQKSSNTEESFHDEEWITMEPSLREKLTVDAVKIQDDLHMLKESLAQLIARSNRFDQLHGKTEAHKLEQYSKIEKQNSKIEEQDSRIESLRCSRSAIDSRLKNFYQEMEAKNEERNVMTENLIKTFAAEGEEREAMFNSLDRAAKNVKDDFKADISGLQEKINLLEMNIGKSTQEFQSLELQLNTHITPQILSHEGGLVVHNQDIEMSWSEIITHGYKISQLEEKLNATTRELEATRHQFATLKAFTHTEAIATAAKVHALEAAHKTQIQNTLNEQLEKQIKQTFERFKKESRYREQVLQHRLSHVEQGLDLYNTSLVAKKETIDDYESRFKDLERHFFQMKPTEMYYLRLLISLFAKKCHTDPNAPQAGTSKVNMLQRHPALSESTKKFFTEAHTIDANVNQATIELPKKVPVVSLACVILGMKNKAARLAYGDVFKYVAGVEIDSDDIMKVVGSSVFYV